jgi:hypothetical protein
LGGGGLGGDDDGGEGGGGRLGWWRRLGSQGSASPACASVPQWCRRRFSAARDCYSSDAALDHRSYRGRCVPSFTSPFLSSANCLVVGCTFNLTAAAGGRLGPPRGGVRSWGEVCPPKHQSRPLIAHESRAVNHPRSAQKGSYGVPVLESPDPPRELAPAAGGGGGGVAPPPHGLVLPAPSSCQQLPAGGWPGARVAPGGRPNFVA